MIHAQQSATIVLVLFAVLLSGCDTVDDLTPLGTFDAIVHGQVVSTEVEEDLGLLDLRASVFGYPDCEGNERWGFQAGPIGAGGRFKYVVQEPTEATLQCVTIQVTHLFGDQQSRRVADTTLVADLELRREPPLDSLEVVEVDLDGVEE